MHSLAVFLLCCNGQPVEMVQCSSDTPFFSWVGPSYKTSAQSSSELARVGQFGISYKGPTMYTHIFQCGSDQRDICLGLDPFRAGVKIPFDET